MTAVVVAMVDGGCSSLYCGGDAGGPVGTLMATVAALAMVLANTAVAHIAVAAAVLCDDIVMTVEAAFMWHIPWPQLNYFCHVGPHSGYR